MAMIKCPVCNSDISDRAIDCPMCGIELAKYSTSIFRCEECGNIVSDGERTCSRCGCPVHQNPLVPTDNNVRNKNSKKVGIIILTVVLLSIIIAAVVYFATGAQRTISKAEQLISEGNLLEAHQLLSSLKDSDKKTTLQAEIYDIAEAEIYGLMNEGQYKGALKALKKYSVITSYDEIYEKLQYETYILTCALQLRPLLKNPQSFQINEVVMILLSNTDSEQSYPAILLSHSGENAIGGYASGYSYFNSSDLSYLGSCRDLDWEKNGLEDIMESITAFLIKGALENEGNSRLEASFDLNRINRLLALASPIDVDITQYPFIAPNVTND